MVDEIYPGEVTEIDIVADEAGRYAFACTRWCGADHWRMRGAVVVTQADGVEAPLPVSAPPLFQQLGIDLDAMRHTSYALPAAASLRAPGRGAGVTVCPVWLADGRGQRRVRWRRPMPSTGCAKIRRWSARSDAELWDWVAFAWLKDVSDEGYRTRPTCTLVTARRVMASSGRGDGPAGVALPGMQKMDPAMPAGPADFTDAGQMLVAGDALLQGKILRGGMGTGMPEFGSLYTDAELWDMVAYLRTFQFEQ